MFEIDESEILSERIRDILKKVCPAFFIINSSMGAVWHHCYCKAIRDHCTCVWRKESKCIAGDWPQLQFIHDLDTERQKETDELLVKAREVISKVKEIKMQVPSADKVFTRLVAAENKIRSLELVSHGQSEAILNLTKPKKRQRPKPKPKKRSKKR